MRASRFPGANHLIENTTFAYTTTSRKYSRVSAMSPAIFRGVCRVIAETFLRQGLGLRGVVSNAAQKCSTYLQNRGSQVPRRWPTIPRHLLQRPQAIDKRRQTFDFRFSLPRCALPQESGRGRASPHSPSSIGAPPAAPTAHSLDTIS